MISSAYRAWVSYALYLAKVSESLSNEARNKQTKKRTMVPPEQVTKSSDRYWWENVRYCLNIKQNEEDDEMCALLSWHL